MVQNINLTFLKANNFRNYNLLLTEREDRTGEYWPEVVTVRTEHREVRTKTTEGQNSPVRLEQARLVSSLLYGTLLILYIFLSNALGQARLVSSLLYSTLLIWHSAHTSGQLNSKVFRRVMTQATQREQALKKKNY